MAAQANRYVFLDISIDNEDIGRIEVELLYNEAPRTAEIFRTLCTGEKGGTFHYKGSQFINIVPGFMCHAGDGICSVKLQPPVERSQRGFNLNYGLQLCTALTVPDDDNVSYSCGSGFFITTAPITWLKPRQHTIFGKVALKSIPVVKAIEQVGTVSGIPQKEVKITDCGEIVNRGLGSWANIASARSPAAVRPPPPPKFRR